MKLQVHQRPKTVCVPTIETLTWLADAREKLECWLRDYNEIGPHGAIGNKVPISLLNPAGVTSPSVATKAGNSSFQ